MSATASLRYSLLSTTSPGRQSLLASLWILFQMALDSAENSPEELFDLLRLRLLTLLLLEPESLLKVVLLLLLRRRWILPWWLLRPELLALLRTMLRCFLFLHLRCLLRLDLLLLLWCILFLSFLQVVWCRVRWCMVLLQCFLWVLQLLLPCMLLIDVHGEKESAADRCAWGKGICRCVWRPSQGKPCARCAWRHSQGKPCARRGHSRITRSRRCQWKTCAIARRATLRMKMSWEAREPNESA